MEDEVEASCSNAESNDTEDDPVIREIPIIHSKRMDLPLYLLQFPLRTKNSTNEFNVKRCFFKPENEEVKLELAIDVESPNFDTGRAEIMAYEVDGRSSSPKPSTSSATGSSKGAPYFESGIADKVVLTSTKVVKSAKKYAIAAYNGKEIHLTSLKGILQMRPTFPYLDKGVKRSRKETAAGNDEDEDDEAEAGPSGAQQVTVKFKQPDDRWKKARESSYQALQAKSAKESWKEYNWHVKGSTLSNVERLKLMTDVMEDVAPDTKMDNKQYIRILVPEDKEEAVAKPALPSHILSLNSLRQLPLLEQCRLLLKDAQIIQFQQLFMLLAGGEGLTADLLLKTLPKVAVLVRGNWIVKSEVLYPKDTLSATSGVPAELMCRARDYVLYLFTKHQFVERKKVSSAIKIPTEEMKEIFTGVSKLRHNKGWELTLPTDQDFVNKHSDIVTKQNLFWEQRFHQLNEFLKDSKDKRQRRKSKSVSDSEGGGTTGRVRNGSFTNNNFSSDESGTEKKSPVAARRSKTVRILDD